MEANLHDIMDVLQASFSGVCGEKFTEDQLLDSRLQSPQIRVRLRDSQHVVLRMPLVI